MRRRLIFAFLTVTLVPLVVLSVLNNRSSRAALTEDANQALFAVASQTANSIDTFVTVNLDAVRTESQLPGLTEFASLPLDEQVDSDAADSVLVTLEVLKRKDPENILSYSILSAGGTVVASTNEAKVGRDLSELIFYQQPLLTGEAFAGPIEFVGESEFGSLHFSAPINSADGQTVGVLLVQYDGAVLQNLLVENNNLVGEDSFAVLFDENLLHLAHGRAPEAIFVPVAALDSATLQQLAQNRRLPDDFNPVPPPELAQLAINLNNVEANPFFSTEDVATGSRINQVATVRLETYPWLLTFFQPQDIFLAPVAAQTQTSIIVGAVIAAVVVLAAIGVGGLLAKPIINLTNVVTRFREGNLDARSDVKSSDETGVLSDGFNKMADRVQELVTSLEKHTTDLESEVEIRTQAETRIQAQNQALVDANQELAKARKAAEDASHVKSEFLATMSHELRTPLNAIIGYSQIILQGIAGEMTTMQRENQERIFANGKSLLSLIDDVLDLAKIEAGRLDIVKEPINLRDWMNSLVSQVQSLADAKNIPLQKMLDDRLPTTIMGDANRLQQITFNLLSNAIKFTDEGYVRLHIQRKDNDVWALVVSDTGIGIPSHAQEYIFDEFRQVDGTSRRKYGGTGLGLAIVRNLSLMMGGNVRLKSSVGEGSTFTVLLPLISAEEELAQTIKLEADGDAVGS